MAALALLCCMSNLSLVVVSRGYSLVVAPHALAAVAAPVAEYGLSALRLQQLQRVGPAAVAHRLSCPVAHRIIVQGLNQCPLHWKANA